VIKKLLQRLIKFAAYTAAAVVILLAIAVGLFRLFLPRLPEYQEDIKAWASTAIGMEVQFSGMDARWGLSGPEVKFYNAELLSVETGATIVAAEEVGVGIALSRIVNDRKAVVDRVIVRQSTLEVRQLEDGQWWIQGSPPKELLPARPRSEGDGQVGRINVIGENLTVELLQPGDIEPRVFDIPQLLISRDSVRTAVDATVELPGDLGDKLVISATQMVQVGDETQSWEVDLEVEDVELAGVSTLHTAEEAQFETGSADLSMSITIDEQRISSATTDLDVDNISIAGSPAFSFEGRLDLLNDSDGWLIAADGFRLETENGAWPLSDMRVEAGTNADGKIATLDVRASYLKIDDVRVARPWLKLEQQTQLDEYAPSGIIKNLEAALTDVDSDSPHFDVVVELEDVGVEAVGKYPGVHGFSGLLRSDRTGGLFEIRSLGMTVDVPTQLPDPVYLSEFSGTIIWRRSNNRTTVLSDSIVFRNDDFAFNTNVEVSLEDGSRKPVVDLATTWSINDIAVAKKYIPYIPRVPRTSEWFQEGLLAGRIPRGTLTLQGPMDKWPFDGGEGHFHVGAQVVDARIMYQRRWPAADVPDLHIAIDNMRLYTERNTIINEGIEITDAQVEIGDFRDPTLSVNLASAGPLDNVRSLLAQSPVGIDTLNGNLDKIAIEGDGQFDLELIVPIRDWQSFEFRSNVQTENATLKMQAFPAPLTNLNGAFSIGRDDISSDELTGTLLGGDVEIDLRPAPATMPGYRIIATANGTATAEALVSELEVPLEDALQGATDFKARLLFARGQEENQQPFQIEVNSDLGGLTIGLPEPINKPAEEKIPLFATLQIPSASDSIVTTGVAGDLLSWRMNFARQNDRWDLDRGVVTFGEESPGEAESRGLHLRGRAEIVTLQRWFDRRRESEGRMGIGDRIRSADMVVDNLFMFGQHIRDHRVQFDRSAQEWLVQVEGEEMVGTASIPYDFKSGRPLVIDMTRMVLPGDEGSGFEDSARNIDPRSLPPITVDVDEFAIGSRFLGEVHATLVKTADGLVTEDLMTRDTSFEISGSGRWVVDESDPTGSHSYVTARMTSSDIEKTMYRLDYDPGIASDDFSMNFDIDWSGGPRDDFRESLNGDVSVRIGIGQLSDVEPGAGRMFGLMSVVALPRRLSLDFRDVFNKGFGFDQIRGRFRLDQGQTYTCNLALEGPAAQIGVVGRASLVDRDYDQTAVVSASFGNALPVVGAVLGGPTVAAVVLIFSQIFKKPLSEVGQIYYGISGSWDEPLIETATAEQFAERGVMLGCIDEEE
jgi:uncharacterized protein (TIGR02099 family)